MIRQFLSSPAHDPALRAAQYAVWKRRDARQRRMQFVLAALGFLGFMPYVSVNIGNNTAVQAGDVLSLLLALCVTTVSWRRKPYWVYPVLIAPLCISVMTVAMSGRGDLNLCWKALMVSAMSCAILLPVQHFGPRYMVALLTGIAVATVLHVLVGFWQAYAFAQGQFPLVEFYNNVSFYNIQEHAEQIARYTRRPFGLFPEPSAMTSSLAPWVLLWIAQFLGLVQFKEQIGRGRRALFITAAASALGLMILSQSGHAAVTLGGVLLMAAIWLLRSRATARNYLSVAVVFGVALPAIVWLAIDSLSARVGGASALGNSSWEERSASLVAGFSILTSGSWSKILFGMGTGLSAGTIWNQARLDAVFSVLLSYIYETGVFGLLAVGCVAAYLLRIWRRQQFDPCFAVIAIVWAVGITLTTSYVQLLPLWVALGWLTIWPEVCQVPAKASARARRDRPPLGNARTQPTLLVDDVRPAPRWSAQRGAPTGE